MSVSQKVTFQNALDTIESLPDYQQEHLIDIVRCRLLEHKRDQFAENIKKARDEYAQGKVKTGTVAELMKELST